MKKFFKALLAAVMTLSLAACGGADEGEKKLVIYSPNSDSLIDSVIPAFEEKTGVVVELITMGTGECLTRIESEKENPQADVLFGGMTAANYEGNPDLFEEYVSPNDAKLPKEYQNYKGYVSRYALDGSAALLINLDVFADLGLNPDEFTSYEDLLNPKLKGQIAMGNPAKSSSAWAELTNMLLVKGNEPYDEAAWTWVESFIANLDGVMLDSSSAIYKGVSAGEYAVGVSYEDPCVSLLVDGATNVKLVYPEEGAVWLPAGSAIIKNAPHLEYAKQFIDFIQSEEGQKVIATTTARPVDTNITNTAEEIIPFSEIKVVVEDEALCTEKKAEWQQKWTDLFEQ